MFKVTITSVRPTLQYDFHKYDADMYDYIQETFIDPGTLIAYKTTISEDQTTEVCEMMFDSKKSWLAYKKDPVIAYHEPKKVRYNMIHMIAVSTNMMDIVVTKDLYNLYLR